MLPPDLLKRIDGFSRLLGAGSIGWMTDRPFQKTLGTGGQGTVLLAERRGAGNFSIPVAMKFFSPHQFKTVANYESEMLRMTEVAAMVARIQDDHLVDVHTVIKDKGVYYLKLAGPKKTIKAAEAEYRASFGGDSKSEKEYEL